MRYFSDDDAADMYIHVLMCEIWKQIEQHTNKFQQKKTVTANAITQVRLRQMTQYIRDHYTERITIKDIAGAASISERVALRCFQQDLHTTIVAYLNLYRLNHAKEQMLTSKKSISDIALSVGFDNIAYFDRVFKQTFGITPTQFIKQAPSIV